MWTSIILAGKSGSRRHSATSFTGNVFGGGNKLSNVRGSIILESGEGETSINRDNSAHFCKEKSTIKSSGMSMFLEYAKNLQNDAGSLVSTT